MVRDKAAKAKKDAKRDMKQEGFATPACKHPNCSYTYAFDGKGTEHVTKTCDDCAQVWRWTNKRR
jgi:DNA-directed RNA polymerase subunit M/transcription elongation factor TFIIS